MLTLYEVWNLKEEIVTNILTSVYYNYLQNESKRRIYCSYVLYNLNMLNVKDHKNITHANFEEVMLLNDLNTGLYVLGKMEYVYGYTYSDLIPKNITKTYIIVEILGRGTFSNVYKCIPIKNLDKCLVVKTLDGFNIKRRKEIKQEINIMNRLKQKKSIYFPEFYGFKQENNSVYFVFEHLQNFLTLHELIKKRKSIVSFVLVKNLIDSLIFLQSMNICHRDIKPENIMINEENLQIKLIDFGFACLSINSEDEINLDKKGTLNYLDPNVYNSENITGEILLQGDIYSMGCVIYETLMGVNICDDFITYALNCDNTIVERSDELFPEYVKTDDRIFLYFMKMFDYDFFPLPGKNRIKNIINELNLFNFDISTFLTRDPLKRSISCY